MYNADQVREVYAELMDEVSLESGRARRRLDFGGAFEVWASVLYPSKNLCIELGPFRQEWLPSDWQTRSLKGFRVHMESQGAMAGSSFRLLLELKDLEQEDLFSIFASSMAASVEPGCAAREAARECWGTLERWKNFFTEKRDGLGREEQIGLFGELWIMNKLADSGLDLLPLIDGWTGALRTDQDFQFRGAGMEVKTTTAVDSDRIRISSSRQLDHTGMEALILVRVALDERQNSGKSLPSMVDDLRARAKEISAGALVMFDERLVRAGYSARHRAMYEVKGYSERAVDFFRVADGFPKLVESDLPAGVMAVKYDISMASCEPFRVTLDHARESLGALKDE